MLQGIQLLHSCMLAKVWSCPSRGKNLCHCQGLHQCVQAFVSCIMLGAVELTLVEVGCFTCDPHVAGGCMVASGCSSAFRDTAHRSASRFQDLGSFGSTWHPSSYAV